MGWDFMSLSVVMPVYNEQEIIEQVVRDINKKIVSKIPDSEFIIVNDCSTDNTLSILQKLSKEVKKMRIITPSKNGGHGKAIRLGFLNAKKDWVFHTDSDNEFELSDFWKLYETKDNYDLVLGQRKHRQDPLHRLVTTRFARLTNFVLFGSLIKDSNSSFKLMKKNALQHILSILPEDGAFYTILISIMARNLNYRIIEIPVKHYGRKTGTCHLNASRLSKEMYRGIKDMLSLRMKAWNLPETEYKMAEEIRNAA